MKYANAIHKATQMRITFSMNSITGFKHKQTSLFRLTTDRRESWHAD